VKQNLLIPIFIVFFSHFVFSQSKKEYKFWNPSSDSLIVLEGQGWPHEVKDYFDRLPARSKNTVRKPVWDLSRNSAGLQLRFKSNAAEIIVKYTVTGNLQMPHMPATGVSGIDLYAVNDDGSWLWAAGKYSFGDTITYRFLSVSASERVYTLYLPLYNTVKWMKVGVPVENSFAALPARKEKPIVVYGTSIAQGACASRPGLAWTNILGRRLNCPIINLGFSGNGRLDKELIDLLIEIDAKIYVLDCMPNMTSGYMTAEELKGRVEHTVHQLQDKKPSTPILITEHDGYTDAAINPVRKKEYTEVNKALKEVVDSLTKSSSAETGKKVFLLSKDEINQDIESMVDGTHPNDIGMMRYAGAYEKKIQKIWKTAAVNHTQSLFKQVKPSLIPLPQQLKWDTGIFKLNNYKFIVVNNSTLRKEAERLQKILLQKGVLTRIVSKATANEAGIELLINKIKVPQNWDEAYHLTVSEKRISLMANTTHGIFNGLQTLAQLMGDDHMLNGCEVTDWPSFSWRGYMVDVGRNFQTIKQLKQQIDVMAAYKLNIFHLHLTEDIAWRLQSKRYPQLTDSSFMIRNKGKYYSMAEMKALIAYCKDKYITLIPEIDMPGHSAAFTRAMGVDMQSEAGMQICKNILTELLKELEVPYIHIGGDEVKITNKDFLPQMVALLKSQGKKVIAWDPGGNVPKGTIKQMWNGNIIPSDQFPAIDSRHLYLNHFDPIDGVVAVFNHQICDAAVGDENKLGATLCNWPDRKVNKEEDLINMNAVYPVMLAFAERCWKGGGWKNYLSDIGSPESERYHAFVSFENRLLKHKALYFKNLSFPYVKQSDIAWKLIGPYKNEGKTQMIFAPESASFFDTVQLINCHSVFGGTIWLRHFWDPMIQSHLNNPEDSTTYYACGKIWSDEAGFKDFWVGFNNISRSPATDSPPVGEWDYKHSKVWVNEKPVEPPHWVRGGQKGNSEIPLVDEGYEYRAPTAIFLHKGWNTVLIKAPVGSFKGNDWQNPVKWMFTFVPL